MEHGPARQEKPNRGPESLNAPIDIPSGFSKDAKRQTAQRVLDLTRNGTERWFLERVLYTYLTQKVSDSELVAIEHAFKKVHGKEKYTATQQTVDSQARAQGLTVVNDVAWFSLYRENPSAQKKKRMGRVIDGKQEAVDITYKEYFTVPIQPKDAQHALADIERFQSVLPSLAKRLADLSLAENDQIKMKVPGNLQSFIKHPDSLVIHYRNPALSQKIRQIVDAELGSVALTTMRENRTSTGFDLDAEKELYDGSHSSLMASVLADKVISAVQVNPQLANASADEFIPFLDRAFGEYAQMPPKDLLAKLDSIKK